MKTFPLLGERINKIADKAMDIHPDLRIVYNTIEDRYLTAKHPASRARLGEILDYIGTVIDDQYAEDPEYINDGYYR
jgi:hypothetical protein